MIDEHLDRLARLRAGDLDPVGFGHREHLGLAYAALEERDFLSAVAEVSAGLRGLTERAGVPEKFNVTITWSLMSLIAERRAAERFAGAEDFIARNQDLLDRALLARFYSPERLKSGLARNVALLPDRVPPQS